MSTVKYHAFIPLIADETGSDSVGAISISEKIGLMGLSGVFEIEDDDSTGLSV